MAAIPIPLINLEAYVLYFFPKINSFLCHKEVLEFERLYSQFQQFNFELVGATPSPNEDIQEYIQEHNITHQIISDTDGFLHDYFEATGLSHRKTVVVFRNSIIDTIVNPLSGTYHATKALEIVKSFVNHSH